jgi:hypothetical protein
MIWTPPPLMVITTCRPRYKDLLAPGRWPPHLANSEAAGEAAAAADAAVDAGAGVSGQPQAGTESFLDEAAS